VAVYRPSTGLFYVKNTNGNGPAQVAIDAGTGLAGLVPMALP
jgi:hypothetical protein